MGSVFKRGKHWWIAYELPRAADGTRKRRCQSCKGMTKPEAKDELLRIEGEVRKGIYVDTSRMTVAEYLDRWVSDCLEGRVRPNTIDTNTVYIRAHINPAIGHIPLSKLTSLHVQDFCKAVSKAKSRLGEVYSPKTVSNIHGVLHSALDQAVRWRLIPYNPADGTVLPRQRRPKKRAGRAEEIAAILRHAKASQYRLPILLALLTGMRRSEVVALRWDDVDQEHRVIWVHRAIGYSPRRGGVYVDETKTYAGDRAILVGERLIAELREHRKQVLQKASDPADLYQDKGWVFAGDTGDILPPAYLGKAFRRLADNAGTNLTLHELRHTHITVLMQAGVLDKTVAERAGHADVNVVTKGIYTHVTPEMQQVAVETMDRFLAEAEGMS